MFYFLGPVLLSYNFFLIAAAVIPAVYLMVKIYQLDKLEKESPTLLFALARAGILSSLIAMVVERILSGFLDLLVTDAGLYQVLLYFVVVAISEEGAKYILLKRTSWNSPEFNCQYDGVIYAVFVSLGFALWENISYVMHYGVSVAIIRAVTAIPGHTCFGVFMGVYYGIAKKLASRGTNDKKYRILAVAVPVLLHGAYDYIASIQSGTIWFIAFILALFIASYYLITKVSREDRFIRNW